MAVAVSTFPIVTKSRYRDVRPDIRSGDLLLCSGSATFSKLIQRATSSVWSHVAFIIRLDSIDRVMVLESVEPIGVRTVPLSHYVRDYKGDGKGYPGRLLLARNSVFDDVTPAELHKLSQFAVDLFGYPYDTEEIIKIAARIAASHLPFSSKERKALKRDREYICSEYVYECYQSVGVSIEYNRLGFVSPKDFAADSDTSAVAELRTE